MTDAPHPSSAQPAEIIQMWFSEPVRPMWFKSTPEFDSGLRDRYAGLWREAAAGNLDDWSATADGALALVIVLDQFPLNMFRDEAAAYSTEAHARRVADIAIARGDDRNLPEERRAFLYLPFMHSENLEDQERSIALYESADMRDNLRWARHHRDIVARFGRFPHRNEALGRASTDAERAWLASDAAFRG
ncbi:MAG: DUF924 family protein [Gammaproteobacteria bacterium]